MMLISNKLYDFLKVIAQDVLPAVAVAVMIIFKAWGLPCSTQIAVTVMAVDLALGIMLHISVKSYNGVMEEMHDFFREDYDRSDNAPIRGNEGLTLNAPADEKTADEKAEAEKAADEEKGDEK